jgi:hypothetical protein
VRWLLAVAAELSGGRIPSGRSESGSAIGRACREEPAVHARVQPLGRQAVGRQTTLGETHRARFPRGSNRSASETSRPGGDLISRRSGTPGRTRTCDLWVRNLRVVRPRRCVASTPSIQPTPPVWSVEFRGAPPTDCPRRCSTVYREADRCGNLSCRSPQDEAHGCARVFTTPPGQLSARSRHSTAARQACPLQGGRGRSHAVDHPDVLRR